MFYISDRAHTLHFWVRFLVFNILSSSRRAGGMWESPVLRFPHFPRLARFLRAIVVLRQAFDAQAVAIEARQGKVGKVHPVIALIDGL